MSANVSQEEDQEEESQNDEGEGEGTGGESEEPPHKVPRLDTTLDDEEGFICQICYEPYTNSGGHRVCCLKCGHIYGKDCIERWIQSQKRCPACNCKAMKKDIRVLYVKNLKVTDTAELDRLKEEISNLKVEKNKIELRNAQLRCKEDVQSKEMQRLQQEIIALRNRNPEVIDITNEAGPSVSCSQSTFTSLRMPNLKLIKNFEIKEGNSRVGAYNEWMNLLVVSHSITNGLYPGGKFGFKKINSIDMKPFQSYPIHDKALRDMSFSPLQTDTLLTVGLDKKAVLFNCNSNCAVQTFTTQNPLWSCCWNSVQPNIFYVGSLNGLVTSYDIRAPSEPYGTLTIPINEKSGVARLKYVPPAYQSQTFNMSGLLIQKLNSVWFAEVAGSGEPTYHQLPLEGPFMNVDLELGSRHVLVSTRPKTTPTLRMGASHVVCTLSKAYSTTEDRDIFSCDIVQTFTGGFQESAIMCRSTLFSPQQGQVYVAANGESPRTVRVWDVSNAEQKALIRVNADTALDFVHGRVNETYFLGTIADKSFELYSIS